MVGALLCGYALGLASAAIVAGLVWLHLTPGSERPMTASEIIDRLKATRSEHMKAGKYVVLNDITPVVFNSPLSHRDMEALGRITSAGYFVQCPEGVVIAGEAISITVPNGKHDKELLERFLAGMVVR